MKKITRDLKKHYRRVKRELKDFYVDISEESWYRMWHIHLDWDRITSLSEKHRRIHILYYLDIFEKIGIQTKENKREFQTWIYLDGDDAIYFHTENPIGGFPYCLDNIEWNKEIPSILIGLLDLSKFNVGVINGETSRLPSYIIQKKGLGLDIRNR